MLTIPRTGKLSSPRPDAAHLVPELKVNLRMELVGVKALESRKFIVGSEFAALCVSALVPTAI